MTATFEELPFDVHFYIALNLDIEDVVHLSQLCRQLHALIGERVLCRRMVEDKYPHTEEARLARLEHITYRQAFQAIYNRRRAFSGALPISARVLGQGQAFVARQNAVCILEGYRLRVFDTASQCEVSNFDILALIQHRLGTLNSVLGTLEITLLNYSHGIIAIHLAIGTHGHNGYVFAIKVGSAIENSQRVLEYFQPASSSKLFVRHNDRYLYYGTHSGDGDDGHRKWEINGIALSCEFLLPKRDRAILLEDFHGTDIGSTVAFEIHNNYFYAVSNQGTFEVEEIDYTSFYHWVRFPVDNPMADVIEKDDRLYRRQHKQGPIHDSWTDLTLQVDERTNEIVIAESRREWAQASSRQSRTFYITKLEPPSTDDEPSLPEDDAFVTLNLIDSSNNPHYKATPDLYSWSQHPEFSLDSTSTTTNPQRSFILARTKFRGYNYSCSSFLDLVEDERCCVNKNDPYQSSCLRLRIGSRRPHIAANTSSPQTFTSNNKGKQRIDRPISPSPSTTTFIDKTTYRYPPIRMWPPPASQCPCASHLHSILNPRLPPNGSNSTAHTRSITGVLDERRLVYMVKAGRGYGPSTGKENSSNGTLGMVVLVDFSRAVENTMASSSSSSASASVSASTSAPPEAGAASRGEAAQQPPTTSSHLQHQQNSHQQQQPTQWTWQPGMYKRCRDGTCAADITF